MATHNDLGKWGEKIAQDYLVARGWAIKETNWHRKGYEIDIVAKKDNVVVFAEVKTRLDKEEDPLEAIDARKIARMAKAAEKYLEEHPEPWEVRFDLFAIKGLPHDYEMEYIPDAFLPPLRKY